MAEGPNKDDRRNRPLALVRFRGPTARTLTRMALRDRVRLFRKDLHLGGLMDHLAQIHRDRRLVEQSTPILLTGGETFLSFFQQTRDGEPTGIISFDLGDFR